MDFHPAANIFPMMSSAEFAGLVGDIRENGLREPILVDASTQTIIDGRNRYRACIEADVIPEFQPWEGSDPVGFVVSKNLHRRHLSESQRAMVASKIANLREGRPDKTTETSGVSQPQAAKLLNVSPDSVGFAKKTIERGAPVLIQAVESGEVAVSTAAILTELPKPEQAEVVARGEKEIIAQANRIKAQRKAEAREERRERIIEKAASLSSLPPGIELLHGDFRTVLTPEYDGSFDLIVTDPPYPKEYIDLYADLVTHAARLLKPGGSLLAMCGQSYFPEIIERVVASGMLTYQWTIAYLTPGGQSAQLWQRSVNTFWKPVLWFVKDEYAGDWIGDVVRSDTNDNDKRYHHWGQSESGMLRLMEKFTEPGMRILDPFVGGGTTAVASTRLVCSFVGVDVDAEAITTTRGRLAEVLNERE